MVRETRLRRNDIIERLNMLAVVVQVFPSDANFLLVQFSEAAKIFEYLVNQKIIVRERSSQPLCEGCLRITVGTSQENEKLFDALEAYY